MVTGPVNVLVWLSDIVPLLFQLRPPVPAPQMPACAKLPVPVNGVSTVLFVTAPRVNVVTSGPLLLMVKFGDVPAVKVVAPNATPAPPLMALGPRPIVKALDPMARVPSVWVTPAPGTKTSERIVAAPLTVVGWALIVVALARSSVPPLTTSVVATVPNALGEPNCRVPAARVLTPATRAAFAAVFKMSVPLFCLVTFTSVLWSAPKSSVVLLLTSKTALPDWVRFPKVNCAESLLVPEMLAPLATSNVVAGMVKVPSV